MRTCEYVAVSLALSLAIGYPVAYYIARHASRTKSLLLILLILPLWISYLMRMLAWVNLLAPDGYVNRFLQYTHIISSPYGWLDGRPITVILALVYGYIPFFILPLYASLDRHRQEPPGGRARPRREPVPHVPARDAAALEDRHPGRRVLIALPMFGDYYTPNIVSGAPTTSMIGNQIDLYFHNTSQPTIGAALTLLLSAFLVILMAYYMVTVARATKEQRA